MRPDSVFLYYDFTQYKETDNFRESCRSLCTVQTQWFTS